MARVAKEVRISTMDGERVLWRYMDVSKFLDLALNSRFYMSTIADFNKSMDRFEGELTQSTREFLGKSIGNSEDYLKKIKQYKNTVYALCWHQNSVENYLMWGAYTSHIDSVAIRTTFGKLKAELEKSVDLLNQNAGSSIGSLFRGTFTDVNYVDETHLDHTYNYYEYFSTKRKYYQGEQECRFLLENKQPNLKQLHTLP
jgi:hypothetical protein